MTRRRQSVSVPWPFMIDAAVIGWKKCGTTSLMRWLADHAEVVAPTTKEPAFFSHDGAWAKGMHWYETQLGAATASDQWLRCDGSTSYADPEYATVVVERMDDVAPDAKLIAVWRDPFQRLLSHYHHEVRRNRRPDVPFSEAALGLGLDDVVVRNSRYSMGLEPHLRSRRGLLVLPAEHLATHGWRLVTDFVGITPSRPGNDANVGADAVSYRVHGHRAMRVLNRVRRHVPDRVASLTRPLLVRPGTHSDVRATEEIAELLPHDVAACLRDEHDWIRQHCAVTGPAPRRP